MTTAPALAAIDREFGTVVVVPRLLDAEQIVTLTRLSRGTIRKMVKERKFPAPVMIGNEQRWDAREYNAWVERAPRLPIGDEDVPRGRPRKAR